MKNYLLKEVCNVEMGQSPQGSSYNEENIGLPLLGGASDLGEVYPQAKKFTTEPSKITQKGDLILCIRATIGDKNWADQEYCLGRGVAGLRPKKDVLDSRYLWHWLEVGKDQLLKQANGSTFKQVTRDAIGSCLIPLPPIAEQKRIAAILDKADAIRRKRQEAIKLTEELGRSLFLDMFGDPVTNPKGWKVAKAIDYCDCIVPGRDKPKSFTGDIPWVTTADLNHLNYTYNSKNSIGLTEAEIKQVKAKIIPKNSVLLTCVGDLGIISIAGQEMVINQQLHSFQCKDINNFFLMYVISFQKDFMFSRATQTTLPYMNKTSCNEIPIIYPPLDLQEKFCVLFHNLIKVNKKNILSHKESENLFNSLLQRAFKGEL